MPGGFDDSDFTISPARTKTELISLAALLRAYAGSLNIDLAPQGFQKELDALPGPYAPPGGELLLAKRGDHVLGCIALKPLEAPLVGEVKRLFVREQARGLGVGKALIEAIIGVARERGYDEIKLDTLPQMQPAIALYTAAGFAPIPAYGSHAYPGLVCFGKALVATGAD
ncbi:MAG: acetyltransferase [Alphaproteobacteria bacterium]|nr:acetyltransferase [Alphaproteobacteria bacterium]MDB5740331.1 acetyltransferase [Alphaproteobacteria bacterium]